MMEPSVNVPSLCGIARYISEENFVLVSKEILKKADYNINSEGNTGEGVEI